MRKSKQVEGYRTLGIAADGTSVATERNGLGLGPDVLEEGDGTVELPAVDGLGGLASVLEGDAEVLAAGAGRLGGRNLGGGVATLFEKSLISIEVFHTECSPSRRDRPVVTIFSRRQARAISLHGNSTTDRASRVRVRQIERHNGDFFEGSGKKSTHHRDSWVCC